jgi:hypothetical protein
MASGGMAAPQPQQVGITLGELQQQVKPKRRMKVMEV